MREERHAAQDALSTRYRGDRAAADGVRFEDLGVAVTADPGGRKRTSYYAYDLIDPSEPISTGPWISVIRVPEVGILNGAARHA